MLAIAIVAALIAIAAASTTRTSLARSVLWIGAAILIGVWIPVVLAGTFDQREVYFGNALGFGLLAWFGSYARLAIVAVGLFLRFRKIAGSR